MGHQLYRGVIQFDRMLDLGLSRRRFESCHLYHGGVAQLARAWVRSPNVVGSNPTPALFA